jgi:hypothetical protein
VKVGHKTRRGRNKTNPVPHGSHRKAGAVRDPLTKAMKREWLRQRRRDERRFLAAAQRDGLA